MNHEADWWRGAAIYEIYPRSFADANGDGMGDLKGITRHLDHVARLGVDGLWIAPFFPSPMRDFGYDVTDHCNVDPRFGTLADFDALVARAHALGLKVLIDQVWSHTSSDHPWFTASRSAREGPQTDWYVWADARPDGGPPSNWQAWFGGPAWTWEPRRGQYYLHNFMADMPDLNFHCPAVQEAVLEAARFWLDRGVDGFRLDTANFYLHDASLLDNPPRPGGGCTPVEMQLHLHNVCQPGNLQFLERLRALLDRYGRGAQSRMTVAEIASEHDLDRMQEYTRGSTRLHTAYSFLLLRARPDAAAIAALMQPWQQGTPEGAGWPAWALSNHDTPRVATRWALPDSVAPPAQREQQLLALLACLRGNVFVYQGEELGLPQAEVPFERMQDPAGRRGWPLHPGRDGCRTPMPWRAQAPHAGFSTTEPWLPVAERHGALAVDIQEADRDSTLHFARRVLALRRRHAALRLGTFTPLHAEADVLVFERAHGTDRCVAAFNLGAVPSTAALPAWPAGEQVAVGAASVVPAAQGVLLQLPAASALLAFES